MQQRKLSAGFSPIAGAAERRLGALISFLVLALIIEIALTHRTLFNDGAFILFNTILERQFIFWETARKSLHALSLWPITFWVKLGWPLDFNTASYLFSAGFFWISVLSLIICYYVLPPDKKGLYFFPLSQWVLGVTPGIGQPTACLVNAVSYYWLVLFFLLYVPLNTFRTRFAFVLLSTPLFLSNELIFVIGIIFALVALNRAKKEEGRAATLLWCFALWSIFAAIVGIYYVVFPWSEDNRTYFLESIFNLYFLYSHDGLNPTSLVCVFGVLSLISLTLAEHVRWLKALMLFLLAFWIAALAFPLLGLLDIESLIMRERPYWGRVWIAISAPILMWCFLRLRNRQIPRVFWFLLAASALILFSISAASNVYYGRFIAQLQASVKACRGEIVIEDSSKMKVPSKVYQNFWSAWTALQISTLVSPDFRVRSVFVVPSDSTQAKEREKLAKFAEMRHGYFDFGEYVLFVKQGVSNCPSDAPIRPEEKSDDQPQATVYPSDLNGQYGKTGSPLI